MNQCRYEQIAEIFENKIRSNEWPIGTKLPNELELAKEYHVGRSTIRETLNTLQEKGMLDKRHGSGTYVMSNKQKIENPLLQLSSTGQMIEAAGYAVNSYFFGAYETKPEQSIQEKLGIGEMDTIVILNRERTANDVPVCFSYNVFPKKIVGDVFSNHFSGSIFQTLSEECKIEISYANTQIKGLNEVNRWDKEAIEHLGGAIILLEQLHVDKNNQVVMFSFDYIRTDIMSLHLRREI